MAIVEHPALNRGLLSANPLKSLNVLPVVPGRIPDLLLRELKPHYTSWLIADALQIKQIRSFKDIYLYVFDGQSWKTAENLQAAERYEQWIALVKKTQNKVGPAISNKVTEAEKKEDEEPELVPTVLITQPVRQSTYEFYDKKILSADLEAYTFKQDDSVATVTEAITGIVQPEAIYNYNPSFNKKKPPQSGDTVQVAVGQALTVRGTYSNTSSITLNWSGASAGSKNIEVEMPEPNVVEEWTAKIPVQPGEYKITASVDGSQSQTSTTLFLPETEEYVVLYQVDDNDKKTLDDKLVLKSDDGGWQSELAVNSLAQKDGWVEAKFLKPKVNGKFILEYHSKNNEEVVIHSDFVYDKYNKKSEQKEKMYNEALEYEKQIRGI